MSEPNEEPSLAQPLSWRDYLLLNAAAWLFAAAAFGATHWIVRDTAGMLYFILVFPAVFAALSALDALADRQGSAGRPAGSSGQ